MMQQPNLLFTEIQQPIKPRYSYLGQLGFLIGFIGAGFIVAAILQAVAIFLIGDKMGTNESMQHFVSRILADPKNANAMRWVQLVSAFFMFFVPVVVTALIISKKSFAYLGFNKMFTAKQVTTVAGIAIFALMLSMALGELNRVIPIPKNWAIKFKAMEDSYNEQVMGIARMKSFTEYLFVMVVIALAPAIFEEALFRAGLQQIITNWTKKPILSIIITSVIFSAIHISFYGFLPRFGLGILLGLIFYYSKNIWLSILMHFLNNGISITALYLTSKNGNPNEDVLDPKFSTASSQIAIIIVGFIAISAVTFLIKYFKNESEKVSPVDTINYLKTDNNPFIHDEVV